MIKYLTRDNINIIDNSFIDKNEVLANFSKDPYAKYLIYLEEDVLGYLYYSDIYERTEINMFEVRKDKRNLNIGSKLLSKFLEITNKPSTLEVRIDNFPAINIYKQFGYKEVAIRKGYYNGIDGILMQKL